MKKYNLMAAFKKSIIIKLILIIIVFGATTACNSDDVGDNLYTFTDKMLGQYLISDSTEFSEFNTVLDTTGVMELLNAYGTYTCFAPTNEAMHKFYLSKGKKSLSDFPLDSLKIIAYDHIISGAVIMYSKFIDGRLPELSMSDRYLSISFINNITYVNKISQILQKDITVHNGVIHKIDEVLNPTRLGIVEVISKDSTFTLFYNALIKTGLADSLLKDKDENYNPALYKDLVLKSKDAGDWYYQEVPAARRYGYTLLMESDATMNANNITDLLSMKAYAAEVYNQMYPEDAGITDITNRNNSLNRFIAYHIIDKQLSYSKFIDAYDEGHAVPTIDMYEYLEPMCPDVLIEVKKERSSGRTNLFNYLRETGEVIQIVKPNFDKDATNGVYHEIDGMLVYDRKVDAELSSKRLRMDPASFFPELTNNNMRGRGLTNPNLRYIFPSRNGYKYIERITCSEQTSINYLTPYDQYHNYEGDEIFLGASSGKLYDFSVITPPIPAGTYEVRFGYVNSGNRGVAQLYFDNVPCGVPLNLNKDALSDFIGWEAPGSNPADPFGFENDKMMRNKGFMKGPASIQVAKTGWYTGLARTGKECLRRIMGTYTFDKAGHHLFTVKGLSGGEFMFDYMEFVPTSALENEDIY